jgi:molecular chaperone GrpE
MLEEDQIVLDDPSANSAGSQHAGSLTLDLTGMQAQLDRLEQRLDGLAEAMGASSGPAALAESLASLEKQISRAGREQFKASTLAEAQRDQLQEVLVALQSAEVERERALDELHSEATAMAVEARRAVARNVIPALDGLEEAVRSGQRLVDSPPPQIVQRSGWFGRKQPETPPDEALRDALRAWLQGLGFVRDRLLAVLAVESITPIPALGEQFNPEIHMAVEVSQPTSNAPPGTITAVLRQGYMLDDQVLRPAEVAVVKAG